MFNNSDFFTLQLSTTMQNAPPEFLGGLTVNKMVELLVNAYEEQLLTRRCRICLTVISKHDNMYWKLRRSIATCHNCTPRRYRYQSRYKVPDHPSILDISVREYRNIFTPFCQMVAPITGVHYLKMTRIMIQLHKSLFIVWCTDCLDKVVDVYNDLSFRLRQVPIRCLSCRKIVLDMGYSDFEAVYVV